MKILTNIFKFTGAILLSILGFTCRFIADFADAVMAGESDEDIQRRQTEEAKEDPVEEVIREQIIRGDI